MHAKRAILQGAVLSSGGMILSMVLQLAGAMIFTRVLRGEDVGVFTLLVLSSDFLTIICNCGLWSSLPKLVASAPAGRRGNLIGAVVVFQTLTALGVALLIYVPWGCIRDPRVFSSDANWTGLYPYLWLLPIIVLFAAMRENILAVQAGLNRYGLRSIGLVVGSFFNLLLVVVAVKYLHAGLAGLMLATLAGYLAAAACSYVLLTEGRWPRFDWPVYWNALRFSAPLYANNLLSFVFVRLDTLFVAVLLGPASVAYYELGVKRLAGYGARVLQAALVPYLPNVSYLIAQGDRRQAARLLDRASNTAAFVCYMGILAALVIQEDLITLLFTRDYLNALPALAPVLVATCLGLQAGIMGQSLIALGKPHIVTTINVVTALLAAGADFVFIPRFGMAGVGWAAVTAMIFTNAMQTWAAYRYGLPLSLRRHVLTHGYMALALVVMAWGGTIPWRLLGVLLFGVASVAGGTIPWSEIRSLVPGRQWMPRRGGA